MLKILEISSLLLFISSVITGYVYFLSYIFNISYLNSLLLLTSIEILVLLFASKIVCFLKKGGEENK